MNNKATFYKPSSFKNGGKNSVLVIGNVQSGKTRFMTQEARRALDGDFDAVIVLAGTNNMLMEQSYQRINDDLRSSGYVVSEVRDNVVKKITSKVIITSLKQSKSLEKINSILHESYNKKILIFDDESDFASINTSRDSYTPIHLLIRQMYQKLERGYFVSVTATPFADLVSSDSFNFDEIKRLKPGDGYKGLVHYNNSKNYKIIEDPSRLKEDNDIKTLLNILIDHVERNVDDYEGRSQLLINNHMKKQKHLEIMSAIELCLEIILSNRLSAFFKDINEHDKIRKILLDLKENIYVINQDTNNWNKEVHSIIIGGALVSRGYTFPDLITCIILNIPKGKIPADTLMQRARWFGYRKNFNKMNIYMPQRLKEAYIEMEELNEIIFNEKNHTKQMIQNEIKSLEFEYVIPTGKVKNE